MKTSATTVKPKRARLRPVQIRIADHVLKQIDKIAYERGTTRSGWIQDLIADALEERRVKEK